MGHTGGPSGGERP